MWLVGSEKHRLRLSKKLSQENSVYFSLKGRHLPCFKSVSAKRALDFQLKLECTGMLIDFKVANFRSIAEPLTFSMQGSKASKASIRSEEHTSELQSLMRISYAVFCLKKK